MEKNGLTIIEVMLAIFIILIGLSGISGVISKIIPIPGLSSLYFEASYLAQEGIELVRNARDENLINSRVWDSGLLPELVPPALAPFTRTITIYKENDNTILITAEVSFPFRGTNYNFSAQEYIYQWYKASPITAD